jgi:hypothetical protein
MEMYTTDKREEEIGCWSCAVDGMKTGKLVCPDCGTEISHYCGMYSHEKVVVSKMEREER